MTLAINGSASRLANDAQQWLTLSCTARLLLSNETLRIPAR